MHEFAFTEVLAEIETHVHAAGWNQGPALFALVRAGRFTADDPDTAGRLGIDALPADALTPVEQGELPDKPLDELLAGIAWPESVDGCVVVQEIVVLPPSVEAELDGDELDRDDSDSEAAATRAAQHPERREARLVAGVLRDGSDATLMRLRAQDPTGSDDLLTGPAGR